MHPRSKPRNSPESPEPRGKDRAGTSVIPVVEGEISVFRAGKNIGNTVRVHTESQGEKRRIGVSEPVGETFVERVSSDRYMNECAAVGEEAEIVIIPGFEAVLVVQERLLHEDPHRAASAQGAARQKGLSRQGRATIARCASDQDLRRQDSQGQ